MKLRHLRKQKRGMPFFTCPHCNERTKTGHYLSSTFNSTAVEGIWICPSLYGPDGRRKVSDDWSGGLGDFLNACRSMGMPGF